MSILYVYRAQVNIFMIQNTNENLQRAESIFNNRTKLGTKWLFDNLGQTITIKSSQFYERV